MNEYIDIEDMLLLLYTLCKFFDWYIYFMKKRRRKENEEEKMMKKNQRINPS